jgi:tRNA-2-methylthio-N6-dimethylallyladenosine synthase
LSRNRPETYYLRSFGCQMNDHDAERIAGVLEALGMRRAASPEEGDALVYNTCSIREKADTRLAGHLSLAGRLKKEDPDKVIVVTGCLAQSRRDRFFADFPFVDILAGPQSLHELPRLLDERLSSGRSAGAFAEATSRWSADLPRVRRDGPLAWVQIVAGCSNFCSYCIVPYVRGPEASRPAEAIVDEVRDLTAEGVREVTLLGQNVNAYGAEPTYCGKDPFPALLEKVCSVSGIERVRFMTSHPKDVSDELIRMLAAPNQVCEHLHLPVQSGSDRVLSAMRRGYDRRTYLELVRRLKHAVPSLSLTTDLIVGFPGESGQDFEDTLSIVEDCAFDAAYTFVYSPRPGTAAAALPGRLPADVAEERMRRLVAVVQAQALSANRALEGQVVEVLVERPSRQDPNVMMGRTRTHKTVNFAGKARPGDLVDVELLTASSTSLRGSLV